MVWLKLVLTCHLTVFSLMTSCPAISLLLRPLAISFSTSISRPLVNDLLCLPYYATIHAQKASALAWSPRLGQEGRWGCPGREK